MMIEGTIVDVFRPCGKKIEQAYDISLILAGSLLLAVSAQISFFLPYSPVPVTAQTFAVLLIAAMLGSKRGSLCMVMYLIEGTMGLPVFSAGRAGPAMLLGPTGGYLIGFVAAAYLIGLLAEKNWDHKITRSIFAMVLGNLVIYLFGVTWLSLFAGIKAAIVSGLYPFIIGDCFKILLAAAVLPTGWKLFETLGLSSGK